jgi:hypothetical protein
MVRPLLRQLFVTDVPIALLRELLAFDELCERLNLGFELSQFLTCEIECEPSNFRLSQFG